MEAKIETLDKRATTDQENMSLYMAAAGRMGMEAYFESFDADIDTAGCWVEVTVIADRPAQLVQVRVKEANKPDSPRVELNLEGVRQLRDTLDAAIKAAEILQREKAGEVAA